MTGSGLRVAILAGAASALTVVSGTGCWNAEREDELSPCACRSSERFEISAHVHPSLDVVHDLEVFVCRGNECFNHRATDGQRDDGLTFLLGEPGSGGMYVYVSGTWPSRPPLRQGDTLRLSVVDHGDGRMLVDAPMALSGQGEHPAGCVMTGPLSCGELGTLFEAVGFPRQCVDRDCEALAVTRLSLAFDTGPVAEDVQRRMYDTPYVVRACQDAICDEAKISFSPGQRLGARGVEFTFGSGLGARNQVEFSATWKNELGSPGAGSGYSLALYGGDVAADENLIAEREGLLERVLDTPDHCDAQGLTCEGFYRRWVVE